MLFFSVLSVAAYSFVYFVNPFPGFTIPLTLGKILTGIMVVASMVVNFFTYTLGWIKNREHTKLRNNIVPINWFYMFAFSAYALFILHTTNAVSWHTIEKSLYSYGALSLGTQVMVESQPNPERRRKVMHFVNNCYQKIVNACVVLGPFVPMAIAAYTNHITGEY